MDKKDVMEGVVYGGLLGTLFYALGGTVAPYVGGLTAAIGGAVGFTGGLALKALE